MNIDILKHHVEHFYAKQPNSVYDLELKIELILEAAARRGRFNEHFSLDKHEFMKEIVYRNFLGVFVLTPKGKRVVESLKKSNLIVRKSWKTGTLKIIWYWNIL